MLRAAALLLVVSPLAARAVETVRIDMGSSAAEVLISADGLSFGQDADDGVFTPIERRTARVSRSGERLELDGVPVVGDAIRFRTAALGGIRSGELHVRGEVVVRVHRGQLQLVNVVPLEDYLAAVLGSEMPVSFPEEALKAQAIAARTYALQRKLDGYGKPFHLGSSVLSQVYGGVGREDPRTRAAVEQTRGLVLTYDLQPIEAYFHASCGGKTETGQAALGRDLPYLASVSCGCGKLPQSRWDLLLPLSELKPLLGADAQKLAVAGRTPTGRATRVSAGARSLDAVSFRQKVGYSRLKSLSFQLEPVSGGRVMIKGSGFGHGAGLCQWGAKLYGEQGWDYRQILQHYYPGAELQQIY